MTKLKNDISTVLQQLRIDLATSTWAVKRYYFNKMLKLAETLNINEPCQMLYDAFVRDGNGSRGRRERHLRCVKLLDAVAVTNAKDDHGALYNVQALPGIAETKEYFKNRRYPFTSGVSIEHLIVKAESEMEYLGLSDSTIGQYRQAWREIRRYFSNKITTEYDVTLLHAFLRNIDLQRKNGYMKEWKWKINRKAAHVLIEVADTGSFRWGLIKSKPYNVSVEIKLINTQYLVSLEQRNLSKATIILHDYVFRKTITFAEIENKNDLLALSPEKIQMVITSFAKICNKRSMSTIIPILRTLLKFFHISGFIEKDLSFIVMRPFFQRDSVAYYLAEKDQVSLVQCLEKEPKRTKAVIILALRLGLRDCDIRNLTFQELDWRNDRIQLKQKKTGKPLVLPLLPDVGNALMDYILNERPKRDDHYPYIFLRKQAPYTKLATVYRICSKLLREKKIKPVNGTATGIHIFRYTLVHRLLAAKLPHQVITDILGHKSKEADKPYLSMDEFMLRKCALDLSVIGRVSWERGTSYE